MLSVYKRLLLFLFQLTAADVQHLLVPNNNSNSTVEVVNFWGRKLFGFPAGFLSWNIKKSFGKTCIHL